MGLAGLLLEQLFRTTLGKPIPAAVFLTINGITLYAGEVLRRRVAPAGGQEPDDQDTTATRPSTTGWPSCRWAAAC